MLTVVKRKRFVGKPVEDGADQGVSSERVKVGRLYLVDLAGSERLKKTQSSGLYLAAPHDIQIAAQDLQVVFASCVFASLLSRRFTSYQFHPQRLV